MKKISLFLMLLSGMCAQGWAHEAPVPINKMLWVVDAGRLRVRFQSGASWWVLNVLGEAPPPPSNWPAALQKEVQTYFDRHFILRADGKTLPSQLVAYRYSEEVWRYYLGSQLDLEFSYALPPTIKVLSGSATFYNEENEGPHETRLHIDGAPAQAVTLTLDHPEFSFSFQGIVRSAAQRWRDAWVEGLTVWQTVFWLVLAFAAFQLQLRTRAGKVVRTIGLLSVSAGLALCLNVRSVLSSGYGVGVFIFFLAIALAVELGLEAYYRRLQSVSQSQAQILFTSQIRFVSLLLGGVTLLLIVQYFKNPS